MTEQGKAVVGGDATHTRIVPAWQPRSARRKFLVVDVLCRARLQHPVQRGWAPAREPAPSPPGPTPELRRHRTHDRVQQEFVTYGTCEGGLTQATTLGGRQRWRGAAPPGAALRQARHGASLGQQLSYGTIYLVCGGNSDAVRSHHGTEGAVGDGTRLRAAGLFQRQ